MNLFGDARREFIARSDQAKNAILYKWPDHNIRKFTQLTVAQDEVAVFARDGQIRGVIPAGRTSLDAAEWPFLGDVLDVATGGNIYLAELYFVGIREFTDLPFGGVIDDVIDPQTQLAVGVRVFGEFALRVHDPVALILNFIGTKRYLEQR